MNIDILAELQQELRTSNEIYGQFKSYAEGIAVIREEYLELETEIFKKPSKRQVKKIHNEALQLAAMAIKLINYSGDR